MTIGDHSFNCSNIGQTGLIHVETVNGNCFALAGMHLISKLLDKSIWATFDHRIRPPTHSAVRCWAATMRLAPSRRAAMAPLPA